MNSKLSAVLTGALISGLLSGGVVFADETKKAGDEGASAQTKTSADADSAKDKDGCKHAKDKDCCKHGKKHGKGCSAKKAAGKKKGDGCGENGCNGKDESSEKKM